MTRQEVIQKYRHELGGIVLDAMQHRSGAEAALFARTILARVEVILGNALDAYVPPKPPVNGQPKGQDGKPLAAR